MKVLGFAIVISVLAFVDVTNAQDISVSQLLDRSEVAYDGTAQLQITLTWHGNQFAYLFDKPLNPTTDRLKVREFSTSLSTSGIGVDEVTTKVFRFTLVPTSAGLGKIQPITISYLKWPDSIPGLLTTEELTIGIGEKRAEVSSGSISTPTIIISILGFVAVAGAGLLVMKSKSRRARVPAISPKDVFLDSLSRLKSDSSGDYGRFQSGLYHLLGDYLSARYTVDAEKMSEDDLAGALNSAGMVYATAQKIAKWYVSAREDRFRPLSPEPGALVRLETDIRTTFETL